MSYTPASGAVHSQRAAQCCCRPHRHVCVRESRLCLESRLHSRRLPLSTFVVASLLPPRPRRTDVDWFTGTWKEVCLYWRSGVRPECGERGKRRSLKFHRSEHPSLIGRRQCTLWAIKNMTVYV